MQLRSITILLVTILMILLTGFPVEANHTIGKKEHISKNQNYHTYRLGHVLNIQIYGLVTSDQATNDNRSKYPILRDTFNVGKYFYSDCKHIYTSPLRVSRKNALIAGGILLAGGLIYANDQRILDGLQRNTAKSWYKPFADIGESIDPLGNTQDWLQYYLAGVGAGYFFKIKPLQTVSVQILESWFIAGGIKNVATIITGRPRPSEKKGARYFKFADGVSFFSGHSSNMFQLATIVSYHVKFWPVTVVCYGLAASVGIHRVHVDAHWPSDVFIGAMVGTFSTRALLKLHEKRNVTIQPEFNSSTKALGCKAIYRF